MRNKKINTNDTKPLIQRLLYYAYKFIELKQDEHKHFHPSSNLEPSVEDSILIDRMVKLCDLVGVPLLDHVIVGGDNSYYFSFKEKDKLPASNLRYSLKNDYNDIEFTVPVAAEGNREDSGIDTVAEESVKKDEMKPGRRNHR